MAKNNYTQKKENGDKVLSCIKFIQLRMNSTEEHILIRKPRLLLAWEHSNLTDQFYISSKHTHKKIQVHIKNSRFPSQHITIHEVIKIHSDQCI